MTKVIGLTGSIGAGKDVVSKYLIKKYNYVQLTVGDVVREAMNKEGIEITRENSDEFSKQRMNKYGKNYWLEQIVEKIKKENYTKVIVDGVRLPENNEILQNSFGKDYILFKVDAEPMIRFQRLQSRGRSDLPKTVEQFENQEKTQNELFKLDVTFNKANAVIDNSTTLEQLYKNIDEVMEKFKDWI